VAALTFGQPADRSSRLPLWKAETDPKKRIMNDKEDTGGFAIQVIAGALAAVTAATLGSTLGIAGTVLGAGIASVISTVGAAVYLRSIRGVHARTGRRWPVVAAGGVLAFVLGMLVITGVEWARGSQLSGGEGTTIGSLVRPAQGPMDRPTEIRIQPGESQSPTVTSSQTPSTTTGQPTSSTPLTSPKPPSTTPPTSTAPEVTGDPEPGPSPVP
jgi:uncharacterized membrane protein YeaQ/YmgE (transglycosylase-associated protein family)